MADDPALALQRALVAALKAHAPLVALVGSRVYDEPPQSPTYPFVRIGNIELRPFRTDGCVAWDLGFSIEVHSRPKKGRVEAARIGGVVVAALDEKHANIAVSGFIFSWCQFVTSLTERDTDAQTYRSVSAFNAVLDVSA